MIHQTYIKNTKQSRDACTPTPAPSEAPSALGILNELNSFSTAMLRPTSAEFITKTLSLSCQLGYQDRVVMPRCHGVTDTTFGSVTSKEDP